MLKCFICSKLNCNENPLNCNSFKEASWSKYLLKSGNGDLWFKEVDVGGRRNKRS